MAIDVQEAFAAIGAELQLERGGRVVEIDVIQRDGSEAYALRYPWGAAPVIETLDLNPKLRHLVLDVTSVQRASSARFLCGHDEFHWFVASVPFGPQTQRVRGAMEALKPDVVRREQRRKGVHHRRHRRKTAVYVRQGEWFFLPRARMHVDERLVERRAELARRGGKPHRVEYLYRPPGSDLVFARGEVSHPDHSTIHLDRWHRVVQNSEPEPIPAAQSFVQMTYLD